LWNILDVSGYFIWLASYVTTITIIPKPTAMGDEDMVRNTPMTDIAAIPRPKLMLHKGSWRL
jgi:hypothetical protein